DEAPLHRGATLCHLAQLYVAPLAVFGAHVAAEGIVVLAQLGHEGAARALECIEVQVQVDAAYRLRAAVAPGQLLLAFDGVLDRVEGGIDRIAHHAVGQRVLGAGARPAPGIRSARHRYRGRVRPHDRYFGTA